MNKKIMMVILLSAMTITIRADEYNVDEYQMHTDEYQVYNSSDSQVMSEYEEHVCDTATPPTVSKPMAFLTQVGCSLLIKYIVLQEAAKQYFAELKQMIGNLFGFYQTKA